LAKYRVVVTYKDGTVRTQEVKAEAERILAVPPPDETIE
jgi:hypothetical protein